ncbi:DUF551 domain-containing protein [Klebsiella pneumoniae]
MTKSTITRERAQQIFLGNGPEPSASEERELARMALEAMDSSESVELPLDYLQGHKDGLEWAARLAEANHPETGDWLYDDPIELAKAIRKGPDMPPAQPVADSEPVAVIDLANLDYLLSGADADVWPPEREEMGDVLLYRHAQPAPVVPDDVLDALQKVARIRLDLNDFDGDRRGITDCLCDAEEALIEVVNRRAAMLAAAPQSPGSDSATMPGKWIPVSERMPDNTEPVLCIEKRADFGTYGQPFVCWHDGGGWVGKTNYRPIVTHWMPLPAAPQEVGDA